jgi:hypothetical protein
MFQEVKPRLMIIRYNWKSQQTKPDWNWHKIAFWILKIYPACILKFKDEVITKFTI